MLSIEDVEEALGRPFGDTAFDCHATSLALVRAGLFPDGARVCRGRARGVTSQHSWVVLGGDCYDPNTDVVDATLWSYDDSVKGVYHGKAKNRPHTPHGAGFIWAYGRPPVPRHEPIALDAEWSPLAKTFLDLMGPLDIDGWAALAHSPVEGWPAKEILTAMANHPRIGPLIPIDILGNATDLNPNNLYW